MFVKRKKIFRRKRLKKGSRGSKIKERRAEFSRELVHFSDGVP